MGNPFLLQACLRLDENEIPKNLEVGKKYHFYKTEHRLYQIKVPMDLRTSDWKFLGRCIILEYTVGNNRTEGFFVMVKLFNKEDEKTITDTYVSDEEVNDVLKKIN